MNKKKLFTHYYYEVDYVKKMIMIIICVVIGLFVYQKNDEIIIPSDAIRVRIIANSNSILDLSKKEELKNKIKNDLYHIVKYAKSSNEANDNIKSNINSINQIVSKYTSDFKINYGLNYFPEKEFKGVKYKEGYYESVVVTLGEGLGDNWWCVLFPPLCMIEAEESTDVEYTTMVKTIIDKYF